MKLSERGAWRLGLVLAMLVLVTVVATPVGAQDNQAQVVAEGPDPAAEDEQDDSLLTLIVGTGPTGWLFMGILLIFSMYSVTVAIERGVATRRIRVLPDEFLGEVQTLSSASEPVGVPGTLQQMGCPDGPGGRSGSRAVRSTAA